MTIAAAAKAGVRSLVVGSAAVGGGIPEHWIATLRDAAMAGLDIVAGLHVRLASLRSSVRNPMRLWCVTIRCARRFRAGRIFQCRASLT
jgi:hypothetical protein